MKPAAAVVSARRAGTTATWDQINKYFALMQTMRILGKNMVFFLHCKELEIKEG